MKSFILYPEKEVTPFLKKNIIKKENLKKSILLGKMLEQKNTLIVEQDSERNVRFNPKFRNKYVSQPGVAKGSFLLLRSSSLFSVFSYFACTAVLHG